MKTAISTALVCFVLASCQSPYKDVPSGLSALPSAVTQEVATPTYANYKIGLMDQISINVFDEPELSLGNVTVDASGSIFVPLIGKVEANGRTAGELAQEIKSRLDDRFLRRAQVSVNIVDATNYAFSIDGRVNKPGRYKIPGKLTLAQALSVGEGPKSDARLSEVIIIRKSDGQIFAAKFNMNEIYAGRQEDPNILPGDLVIVGFDRAEALVKDLIPVLATLSSLFIVISQSN